MKSNTKGIPVVVLTCAFAMFAIAAIPTHAKAFSYPYFNEPTGYSTGGYGYVGGNAYGHGSGGYRDSIYYGYGNGGYGQNGYGNGYGYYNQIPYSYPTYETYPVYTYSTYTYPVIVQAPRRRTIEPDYFYRDWTRAANEWDNLAGYWSR